MSAPANVSRPDPRCFAKKPSYKRINYQRKCTEVHISLSVIKLMFKIIQNSISGNYVTSIIPYLMGNKMCKV